MALRPNPCFGLHALSVAVVLAAGLARAEPARSFELVWRAPASCPAGDEVEREITRLVGGGARSRATLRASAEVTRNDEEGWRVRIRLQDAGRVSERSFNGDTCKAVTKVAALIIALTIEPNAGSPSEAAPVAPVEKQPPPALPSAPEPPVEAPRRWFLAAGPLTELRLLPRLGFGVEIGLGLRLASFSAELRGAASVPQSTDVESSGAGGRFSLGAAGVRVCARIVPGWAEIFGCAAGSLERLAAEGYGVTVPGSAVGYLGTMALGPRLDLRLGAASRLSFGLDATHTFNQANFVLDNVGSIHRTPRWGGSARLQVAWLF